MANPHQHAMLTCVLKVDPRCHACKMHTFEILGAIDGVYEVSIDAETNTTRIVGEVDPNLYIRALGRSGVHAELVSTNLTHPMLARGGFGSDYFPRIGGGMYDHSPYNLGYYGEPYQRSLEGMWHDYPMINGMPGYSYNSSYGYGGSYYPPRYPTLW